MAHASPTGIITTQQPSSDHMKLACPETWHINPQIQLCATPEVLTSIGRQKVQCLTLALNEQQDCKSIATYLSQVCLVR